MEKNFSSKIDTSPIVNPVIEERGIEQEIIPEAREKAHQTIEALKKIGLLDFEERHHVLVPGTRAEVGEVLNLWREVLKKGEKASLYYNIGVCSGPCRYCRYEKLIAQRPEEIHKIVGEISDNLSRETDIFQQKMGIEKLPASSVYVGGGTPTLMDVQQIEKLFKIINKSSSPQGAEITMESTPETLTPTKIAEMRKFGVSRISMGIQRFDDEWLKKMERRHSVADALKALEYLQRSGVRYNIDLMYGFDDQTIESCCDDILQTLKYNPTEITRYRVENKRRRDSYVIPVSRAPREISYTMQEAGREVLKRCNYHEGPSGWFTQPNAQRTVVYQDRWERIAPLVGFGPWTYSYDAKQQHTNLPWEEYVEALATNQLPLDPNLSYKYNDEQAELRRMIFSLKYNFRTTFEPRHEEFIHSLVKVGLGTIVTEGQKQIFQLSDIGIIAVEEILGILVGKSQSQLK